MTIYRVVILMDKDYELEFTQVDFATLLGFEKREEATCFVGNKIPNITRSDDWVFLHCDLITRRVNNVESSVLFSFATANVQVSYPFQTEPLRLEWQPVNKSQIYSIRVWVSDGRNNILDLNGADVATGLVIEEE